MWGEFNILKNVSEVNTKIVRENFEAAKKNFMLKKFGHTINTTINKKFEAPIVRSWNKW